MHARNKKCDEMNGEKKYRQQQQNTKDLYARNVRRSALIGQFEGIVLFGMRYSNASLPVWHL